MASKRDPKADPKANPKAGAGGSQADAETSTSAGIDDPVIRARLDLERAKIAEAQAKINALTGGRTSRTASVVSKGEANISVTQTVKKTVQASASPTTYLDPRTGTLRVVMPEPPTLPGTSTLLDSLPEGPNLPRPRGDEATTKEQQRAVEAGGIPGPSCKQPATEGSEKEEEDEGARPLEDEGEKQSEGSEGSKKVLVGGGTLAAGSQFTKVVLKSIASGYHYQIFLVVEHDY